MIKAKLKHIPLIRHFVFAFYLHCMAQFSNTRQNIENCKESDILLPHLKAVKLICHSFIKVAEETGVWNLRLRILLLIAQQSSYVSCLHWVLLYPPPSPTEMMWR